MWWDGVKPLGGKLVMFFYSKNSPCTQMPRLSPFSSTTVTVLEVSWSPQNKYLWRIIKFQSCSLQQAHAWHAPTCLLLWLLLVTWLSGQWGGGRDSSSGGPFFLGQAILTFSDISFPMQLFEMTVLEFFKWLVPGRITALAAPHCPSKPHWQFATITVQNSCQN